METTQFTQLMESFQSADVDGKIRLYVETEDLTREQYRSLLQYYPIEHLKKLETALG